jgi:hypothetical protein
VRPRRTTSRCVCAARARAISTPCAQTADWAAAPKDPTDPPRGDMTHLHRAFSRRAEPDPPALPVARAPARHRRAARPRAPRARAALRLSHVRLLLLLRVPLSCVRPALRTPNRTASAPRTRCARRTAPLQRRAPAAHAEPHRFSAAHPLRTPNRTRPAPGVRNRAFLNPVSRCIGGLRKGLYRRNSPIQGLTSQTGGGLRLRARLAALVARGQLLPLPPWSHRRPDCPEEPGRPPPSRLLTPLRAGVSD